MSELVKRQHYVPQTYLKHFGFTKNKSHFIHALKKEANSYKEIQEMNISNIALKNNLYTLPGKTVDEKMALERFYSNNLESHYNSIYNILTDPHKLFINDNERELIVSTVITMFYRTTHWLKSHYNVVKNKYQYIYQMCIDKDYKYFKDEGRKVFLNDKTLEELIHENTFAMQHKYVLSQLEIAYKLIEKRLNIDTIKVCELTETDDLFVTSDNPVTIFNPFKTNPRPFDSTNFIGLPLNSKLLLQLLPANNHENKNRIFRSKLTGFMCNTERKCTNIQQLVSSERFILGDKNSLIRFIKNNRIK